MTVQPGNNNRNNYRGRGFTSSAFSAGSSSESTWNSRFGDLSYKGLREKTAQRDAKFKQKRDTNSRRFDWYKEAVASNKNSKSKPKSKSKPSVKPTTTATATSVKPKTIAQSIAATAQTTASPAKPINAQLRPNIYNPRATALSQARQYRGGAGVNGNYGRPQSSFGVRRQPTAKPMPRYMGRTWR